MHRLTGIKKAERYSSDVPFEVAAQLPVTLPNLADPSQPAYAYRFLCTCPERGAWTVSRDAAIDAWCEHVQTPEVVAEEEYRDEIVRLADQLGAKLGLAGLAWIKGLAELDAAHPSFTVASGCPDCGLPDEQGHETSCFYYVKPATE